VVAKAQFILARRSFSAKGRDNFAKLARRPFGGFINPFFIYYKTSIYKNSQTTEPKR